MIKEIENIIKNKTYFELTNDERLQVEEWAQNEEEYNNMKWFLTGATSFAASEKITASPALKKGVMAHLTESKKKKGFWLNSVGILALPKQVPFYRKPAFQLGIAAVAVIGLLFFFNNRMGEDDLALNNTPIDTPNQKILPVENTALEQDGLKDEISILTEENSDQLTNELEKKEDILESKEIVTINKNESDRFKMGNTNSRENDFGLAPPPPIIADVMRVEDDEEVLTISDKGEDIEIEEKNWFGGDEEEEIIEFLEEESYGAGNPVVENKQERGKVFKKKVLHAQKDSKNQDYRSDLVDKVDEPSAFDGIDSRRENDEWIKPKSLHINKTKELNSLFFTVK